MLRTRGHNNQLKPLLLNGVKNQMNAALMWLLKKYHNVCSYWQHAWYNDNPPILINKPVEDCITSNMENLNDETWNHLH